MNNPIISIIVPVFNATDYLNQCLNSLLQQSKVNCEIILVDDGSTDDSGIICDKFAVEDERVRVVHQLNGGVGKARNMGIEQAKGEYITFVDADDSVQADIYETMLNEAEKNNVDYVICAYNEVSGGKTTQRLFSLLDRHLMDRESVVRRLLGSIYAGESIINSPCNKLFKSSIIIKHKLRFSNRKRGEDWLFNIQYLEYVQSAIYINTPLYNYNRHGNSVMSQVLPEQFDLWKENAQIRREISERYQIAVDWKDVNKHFLEGVIPWVMSMYKQGKDFGFNTVFKDKEFLDACKNSHPLDGLRIELVRKMINVSFQGAARFLCQI